MKTLVILSDTHGSRRGLESIRSLLLENDYVVHLGDGAGDLRAVEGLDPNKAYACAGNCDFFAPQPLEGIIEVERLRIFCCHGHTYGVKKDLTRLAQEAKSRDCDIALYGHTHTPLVSKIDGVTLINPGTLKNPVDKGGSYCYLVIHGDKATPTLVGEGI